MADGRVSAARADGTLTAAMARQPTQSGRWSLDPAGRVHTDVMGSPMVIDVWVTGDVLTLVLNGQGLNPGARRLTPCAPGGHPDCRSRPHCDRSADGLC
jgi:hypothetical protein